MQVMYTAGQRLLFFFPITAMWLVGHTAMAITSVLVTSSTAALDRWDPKQPSKHFAQVCGVAVAMALGGCFQCGHACNCVAHGLAAALGCCLWVVMFKAVLARLQAAGSTLRQ